MTCVFFFILKDAILYVEVIGHMLHCGLPTVILQHDSKHRSGGLCMGREYKDWVWGTTNRCRVRKKKQRGFVVKSR